jgi:hypothetical protein
MSIARVALAPLAAQTLVDFVSTRYGTCDGTMGWELGGHALEAATRTFRAQRPRRHASQNAAEAIRRQFGVSLDDPLAG